MENRSKPPRSKGTKPSAPRRPRVPRHRAVSFNIWSMSGGNLSQSVVDEFDRAMQRVVDQHPEARILCNMVKV